MKPSELALSLSKGANEGITALAGELGAEPPRVSFATFLADARKVGEEVSENNQRGLLTVYLMLLFWAIKEKTMIKNVLVLLCSVAVCLFAGVIGSIFTYPSIPTWYAGLIKPALNPPNWIFGPVWTTLYILMGISLYLIIKKGKPDRTIITAIIFFALQLTLNTFWSIIFFGWHMIFLALITIIALWVLILINIVLFYKIDKLAGILLIPYILWVSFATYLNYALWTLNM